MSSASGWLRLGSGSLLYLLLCQVPPFLFLVPKEAMLFKEGCQLLIPSGQFSEILEEACAIFARHNSEQGQRELFDYLIYRTHGHNIY